jgi:hypothetical protein
MTKRRRTLLLCIGLPLALVAFMAFIRLLSIAIR